MLVNNNQATTMVQTSEVPANPLYKTQINVSSREPLPEQGDIGVNLDSVVLTIVNGQKKQ